MARRILLADDSVTAQNMGRRILTDAGYEVVTVNNGSAALKKIAEQKPDLIVLDVYMPGYGGLEVCQRIKETRETARIPVLLSVGKLEPFKPEEARRVRADAFIVKPFEASELLTALTRLEDKIVPHGEPYKPGRFAKAIAAAEGADLADSFGDKETGWKDRLIIPSPRAKPAESEAEVPPPTNTAFRDLARAGDFKPAEPQSGFERPIPAGLPPDITPEEIAAITAAAAAFGGKVAIPAAQPGPVAVETPKPEATASEATSAEVPAATFASAPEAPSEVASQSTPAVEEVQPAMEVAATSPAAVANESADQPAAAQAADAAAPAAPDVAAQVVEKPAAAQDEEVAAALASLAPNNGHGSGSVQENEPVPATVAATIAALTAVKTVASGPRWLAEEIALGENESVFLLEREMEKTYAAFAAADAARMSLSAAAVATASSPAGDSSAAALPASLMIESSAPAAAESKPDEPQPAAPTEAAAEAASTSETAPAAEITTPVVSDANLEPAKEEAAYAAAASASCESTTTVEAVSQPIAVPQTPGSPPAIPEESDPKREAELAAAWANWRQIRESIVGSQLTTQIADAAAAELIETRQDEPAAAKAEEPQVSPEPTSDEAASAATSESTAIANIVDSVLAELKPKLVEEIARKMGNDKKKKKKKD